MRTALIKALLFIALTANSFCLPAFALQNAFPKWNLTTLSGQQINLSSNAKPMVIIIGFKHQQQSQINPWLTAFLANSTITVYELPFVDNRWEKFDPAIKKFMAGKLPNKNWKANVAPLYGDKGSIMNAVNIGNDNTIHLFLVSTSGQVLARTNGAYSKSKAETFLKKASI